MIPRSLLRQSRIFCARLPFIPTPSPIKSQLSPSRIRSLQERLAVRYYSSTHTPKDGASSEAAAAEASQSDIKDSDPARKDIEAKSREIIDLKVRPKLREPQCYLLSQSHTFDI